MKSLIIILCFVPFAHLLTQNYQMVNYNIESQTLDTIPSFMFDTSKTSDYTDWDFGINNEVEILNLDPPSNTFNNSGFTDIFPARDFFNIDKYPIRTAVNIFRKESDTLKQTCSGILVSKNYVLTACHCVGSYDTLGNFVFKDSIYIFPSYDNGIENPRWGNTRAIEFNTFSENMKGTYVPEIDIVLIKLEDSLGLNTGWMGFGFNEDTLFFEDNVFHKLSYPGTVDYSDTTRVYNGDTLYYNYGKLDLVDSEWLGFGIFGIKGQSGSSIFHTNNDKYFSLGTLSWAANSRHTRINREIYYSFESIIDNKITSIKRPDLVLDNYFISDAYPNPFNPSTKIIYSIPKGSIVSINVFNLLGEHITTLVDAYKSKGVHKVEFDGTNLSSGLYFYIMEADKYIASKKVLLLK